MLSKLKSSSGGGGSRVRPATPNSSTPVSKKNPRKTIEIVDDSSSSSSDDDDDDEELNELDEDDYEIIGQQKRLLSNSNNDDDDDDEEEEDEESSPPKKAKVNDDEEDADEEMEEEDDDDDDDGDDEDFDPSDAFHQQHRGGRNRHRRYRSTAVSSSSQQPQSQRPVTVTPTEGEVERLNTLLDQTTMYTQFLGNAVTSKSSQKKQEVNDAERFNGLLSGGTLRSYQVDGVRWLVSLYENGSNGILADEMGLGKTIMIITFVAHLRAHGVRGPILVVAPLSTLPQWQKEFAKWAPSVATILYHGTKEERAEMREQKMQVNKKGMIEQPLVVLTSYALVLRDELFLCGVRWKYIVVDEGHRLKNFECKLVNVLKSFPSDNRLILTGTPLQNNMRELWSLLNFLLPEIFDSLNTFENWFNFDERTLEQASTARVLLNRERSEMIISKLHGILRPFILRRVKTDVLQELPKKREVVLLTPLTPLQVYYYTAILSKRLHLIGPDATRTLAHNAHMQLRKICNHPYLVRDSPDTNESLVRVCGKMRMLDQVLLRLKREGRRVLIFSQFTSMLDILEDYLTLRDYKYCRFDGSSSSEERQDEVAAFTNDASNFVFLLSTRSGGLGINLVAADTVILFDSDWNPTQDAQAQDRVHRIGQHREVLVIRFITPHLTDTVESVELGLLTRAMSKKKLHELIIGKGNLLGLSSVDDARAHERWQGTVRPLNVDELRETVLGGDIEALLARAKSNLEQQQQQQQVSTTMVGADEKQEDDDDDDDDDDDSKYVLSEDILNAIMDRSPKTFTTEGLAQLNTVLGTAGFVLQQQDTASDIFVDND